MEWLYLAMILDLFSRRVVGWSLSEWMTRPLPLDALEMALARRRPPKGLIHHSDRGSQYASHDYRRALDANRIVCSMSRRGNCWDNAVTESFFSTLKVELVSETTWTTRHQARAEVFEYLEVSDNAVVLLLSDHGFRPWPTAPDFDILPTLLFAVDQPRALDQRGRVLEELFTETMLARRPKRGVASFHTASSATPVAPPRSKADERILDELRSLGYIE